MKMNSAAVLMFSRRFGNISISFWQNLLTDASKGQLYNNKQLRRIDTLLPNKVQTLFTNSDHFVRSNLILSRLFCLTCTRQFCSERHDGDKEDTRKTSQPENGNAKKMEAASASEDLDRDEPPELVQILPEKKKIKIINLLPKAETKEAPTATAAQEVKPYNQRRRRVIYEKYTDNNTVTAVRAMTEYLLKSSDLEHLRKTSRRSPYDREPNEIPLFVYLKSDVQHKAMEVWGSKEALDREKKARREKEVAYKEEMFLMKSAVRSFEGAEGWTMEEKAKAETQQFFTGSEKVVFSAIAINFINLIVKSVAWSYSGSSSIFAEVIHSAADVVNQVILAIGIQQSKKKPSSEHPYGFASLRYVTSLISGVAFFCLGSGVSCYHGITMLMHPEHMGSLIWPMFLLGTSLFTEGATLVMAINAIKRGAAQEKLTFWEYVGSSRDPSLNVVFLEDLAAVMSVLVAGTCMGLTTYTGNPLYDAGGAIGVGGILGMVSMFLIYTNTASLVGRSIPSDQLSNIREVLENDIMVRGVYDIKATYLGVDTIRFKAELDIDESEIARSYLDRQDLDALLLECQSMQSIEQTDTFMLKHGGGITYTLGAEIDRLEKLIKKINPKVRHVDLELL